MKNDKDFAVVIGIRHYKGLKPLEGAEGDADRFEKWLLEEAGGNMPPENCKRVVCSENPLRPLQDDVDERFGEIFETLGAAGKARRLYFYFSGHGLGLRPEETALVLPKWTTTFRAFALSASKYLSTLVEKGSFNEIFFFLDCCRNRIPGTGGAQPYFAAPKPDSAAAKCNAYLWYATEYESPAFEAELKEQNGDDLNTRGLFTEALLTGLRGAAKDPNQGGVITTKSLMNYLTSYLPELAQQKKLAQYPRFGGENSGEVVITGTPPSQKIKVKICFKTAGRGVKLEDPTLQLIKEGNSNVDWELELLPGNYAISDSNNNVQLLRIDGQQNPLVYEF